LSKTILYILGAGASCQAVPLAADLADRLLSSADKLKTINPQKSQLDPNRSLPVDLWKETREGFVKSLEWLGSESRRHVSVDTYAKKLFFKNDRQKLNELKVVLSSYLLVEQSLNPTDKRYDAFFATVLKLDNQQKIRLPQILRIITWNYDTQLEKAFYEFCDDADHVAEEITFNKNIYRVNGYCATEKPGHIGPAFRSVWKSKNPVSAWEEGLRLYWRYKSENDAIVPDIRFAWEESTKNKIAQVDLHEVHTVVVIGYSFPYFNQEIDDYIWTSLSDSQVNRVYLQYPDGQHASIENRVRSLIHPSKRDKIKFMLIPAAVLFCLPEEFWQY
jgi:hypothetical protein